MKNFLKNIVLFFLLALIVGEIAVRVTHAISDIPQRTIDEFGIQKYYPNQNGYWKGGEHTWMVNELGWPGELPKSYDNLMIVIGDSFIENFMNPDECHQAVLLKENMKNYNFMEAARSGVSFIEAMEISKQFEHLNPIKNLIYVHDSDFYESINEIKTLSDITQLNTTTNTIVYGKMNSAAAKKVLYNWKLLYYFYNRFPLSQVLKNNKNSDKKEVTENAENKATFKDEVQKLLKYTVENYTIEDKVLVFFPNSGDDIIEACKAKGFKTIKLDAGKDNKSWTFDYDKHWTCYGHEQVAKQVSSYLSKYVSIR